MSKNNVDQATKIFEENIYSKNEILNVEDRIESSMLSYGDHIIRNRAIPNVFDGLKPVQRRTLYTFKYLNNIGKNIKLSNISGACMGNFHPHGDSSINETVVNLVQQWKNNFPYLEGIGTWGSMSGDAAAAPRYIEVKLPNDISELLFENLEKDQVVSWSKTYDESKLEPLLLPVKYPYHLINGTDGIAYSMGTSIPSYNIKELTKLFIYLIENKFYSDDFNVDEHADKMKEIVLGVDLPTGVNVYMKDGDYLFDTNFGIGMRATFEVDKKTSTIVIKHLPIDVTTEKLKDEITELALDYRVQGTGKKEVKIPKDATEILQLKTNGNGIPLFVDYEKDKNGEPYPTTASITLSFKASADLDVELLKLLSKTSLETSFRANMVVINSNGCPESLSLYQNVRNFLWFRLHCVYQAIKHDIKKLNEQVHVLEGLQFVLSDKKRFFDILYNAENLVDDLIKNYPNLSEEQIKYISDSKLTKLAKNEVDDLINDINDKLSKTKAKNSIIETDSALFDYIKKDYEKLLDSRLISGFERKSKIISVSDKINLSDLIEDEEVIVLSMSDETIGFISSAKHKAYNRGAKLHGAKNEFDIDGTVDIAYYGMLKDEALFITNKGRVFKESIWKLSKRFQNIRNYLSLDKDEKVISITKYDPNDTENTHLLMITNSMVKNIRLDLFDAATNNRGIIGIKLNEDDNLTSVILHNPNIKQDLIILTVDGKILRIDKDEIPEIKGRATIGQRVISKKVTVLKSLLIEKQPFEIEYVDRTFINPQTKEKIDTKVENINYIDDGKNLLLISDLGKGKLVSLHEIPLKKIKQNPVVIFNNDEKNGNLINGFLLDENKSNYELTLVSKDSDITVIKVDDLNSVSRTAKGSLKFISNEKNDEIVYCFLREGESQIKFIEQ